MPYDPNETPVGYDPTSGCEYCSGWGCPACAHDAGGQEQPLSPAERREIERNLVAPLFPLTFPATEGDE